VEPITDSETSSDLKKSKKSKKEKKVKEDREVKNALKAERLRRESPELKESPTEVNPSVIPLDIYSLNANVHSSFSSASSSSSPKTSDADTSSPTFLTSSDSPRGSYESGGSKGNPVDRSSPDMGSAFGEWQDLEQSIISASDARAKWLELENQTRTNDDNSLTRKAGKTFSGSGTSPTNTPRSGSFINDKKKGFLAVIFIIE